MQDLVSEAATKVFKEHMKQVVTPMIDEKVEEACLQVLVDNAIVIVDEVRSRLLSGLPRAAAIADGVRHLAMPLFGSTLTTSSRQE